MTHKKSERYNPLLLKVGSPSLMITILLTFHGSSHAWECGIPPSSITFPNDIEMLISKISKEKKMEPLLDTMVLLLMRFSIILTVPAEIGTLVI